MSGVKLKRVTTFPRQVIGGAGIDVEKQNGNFTISLDYAEFGLHSPYVPAPDHRVVIFAQGTSGYFTVPTSVLSTFALTTWNPSDKTAGIALSNNNLTYTGSGAARSSRGHSAGKAYWEVLVVQDSGESGASWNVGFSDGVATFSQIQTTGVILMAFVGSGNIANGAGATIGSAIANGDIICIAADLGAKLGWFRKNGGNWLNSPTNNPATGIGGITFTGSGPWFASAASSQVTTSYIANFGASAFSFAVPSGFTAWNSLP
jgi:hypothetical protein